MRNTLHSVLHLDSMVWPNLDLPSKQFRLFIAADATKIHDDQIETFAEAALSTGMIYCCTWGPDCSRVHDLFDDVILADELGPGLYAPPTADDVIMTTWHERDSLKKAVWYFANCTFPTKSFEHESEFWLAIAIGNRRWAASIERYLSSELAR